MSTILSTSLMPDDVDPWFLLLDSSTIEPDDFRHDRVSSTTTAAASDNSTGNDVTPGVGSSPYEPWEAALIVMACGVIVCGTIVGNILVCTAVAIVRRLRTPSNLLIVSLAVSDLLVALLVMPFATVYEVMGRWDLGQPVCDMWTSLDVLLCTASILSLCAISIDRYFVITRPFQYAMKRTPVRMTLMIIAVWLLSALISIPPLFGWKPERRTGHCQVSQQIGYQFYATIGAFYLPVAVMIVIYTRIYLVSSRIAHAEAMSKPIVVAGGLPVQPTAPTSGSATPLRRETTATESPVNHDDHQHNGHGNTQFQRSSGGGNAPLITSLTSSTISGNISTSGRNSRRFRLFGKSRLNRISSSNERKATKTLGVIMGAFSACWLPFFILALIKPFCRQPETCIPHWLNGLFLWLGYANSFLNPIIYARFNRDFRTPFKHILQCHIADINSRLRSENYAEQFGRDTVGRSGACGGGSELHVGRDCVSSKSQPPAQSTFR